MEFKIELYTIIYICAEMLETDCQKNYQNLKINDEQFKKKFKLLKPFP